jgi:hypothetical protein
VRRAAGFREKTGTHHACTDGDDAEGDEEANGIIAIAVRLSSTVVVAPSAPRRSSAALHLGLGLLERVCVGRRGLMGGTVGGMPWLGPLVPSAPHWVSTLGRACGPGGRVLVHH